MLLRDPMASAHDNVRKPRDDRHAHAPEEHGGSGVKELPNNRQIFEPTGDRAVRIGGTMCLHQIDLLVAEQHTNAPDFAPESRRKLSLGHGILRPAQMM